MRNTTTTPKLNTNLSQLNGDGRFIDIVEALAPFADQVGRWARNSRR